MSASLLMAAVFGIAMGGPCLAGVLTCEAFKVRLNGALLAAAGGEATSIAFRPGFTDPARGTRYDWSASDLDGTMNCDPADAFQEFGVSVRFKSKESFAETVKQFITVQGASICALASDVTSTCEDAGRGMLQDALSQMGAAYNHGVRSPSGLVDRTLLPKVDAELTSASNLVTFLIGPGRGASMEDARQPLLKLPGPPVP